MSNEKEQEPHFRLLVCRTCHVIEELPSGEEDPQNFLLDIAVERHQHNDFTFGALFNVPKGIWMAPKMKEEVIKYIQGQVGSGLDSFGTQFYETKSQFGQDAMDCYNIHLRPKGQCSDYKTEKKRLSPGTAKDRRDAGMSERVGGPKVYLCDFCPVKSFNMKKHNETSGLYN